MPSHSATAGSIILQEAYALGKMMDSSSWNGLLRSGITPSDIDLPGVQMVFDNRGMIIFCDFSSSFTKWQTALTGQRLLYEGLINYKPHCAVLCRHNVKPELGRPINTLHDVEHFQVMIWDFEPVITKIFDGAELWKRFVIKWVNEPSGPLEIRRRILGEKVGMQVAQQVRPAPPSSRDAIDGGHVADYVMGRSP
jgi:hypothetical protein